MFQEEVFIDVSLGLDEGIEVRISSVTCAVMCYSVTQYRRKNRILEEKEGME